MHNAKKDYANMLNHQIRALLSEYVLNLCDDNSSSQSDISSKIKGASEFSSFLTSRLDLMNNLTDFSALESINNSTTTTNNQLSFDISDAFDNVVDNNDGDDDDVATLEESVIVSNSDNNTKSKIYVSKKWSRDLIEKLENFTLDFIKSKKKVTRDKVLTAFNNSMLNEIPVEDRVVVGNRNAPYIAKYWKNINNRLVQTNKVFLVDGEFVYNENFQETA